MAARIDPKTGVTEKQDKFAKLVVTEGCLSTAYRGAYNAEKMKPQSVWSKACILAGEGNVSSRIAYWRERAAKKHLVTVESLTAELEEARALAKQTAQPSAMVSAIKEKAVLHGVRVEKKETNISGNLNTNQDAALEAMKRKHATKPK